MVGLNFEEVEVDRVKTRNCPFLDFEPRSPKQSVEHLLLRMRPII